MTEPWKLFGRLGNQMFQYAFLYSYAKDNGIDYYYQDPAFFEKHADDIRWLFGQNIPRKIDQVSIHVRRGDYVGNPFYVDLMTTGYYEKAMAMFPNEEFLVFSDDIEWCERQEIFRDCEFAEGNSEIEDMNLMAACKAHIIANSSFSWWAAFLSGRKTIAPKAWYSDQVERTKCPSTWTRI